MNRIRNAVRSIVAGSIAVMVGGSAMAGTVSSDLTYWNLVVLGDLVSTSEVEGTAFVGGDLSGPSSNYATLLSPAAYNGLTTLAVGGAMNAANVNVNAGNFAFGGSLNGTANVNNGTANATGGLGAIASSLAAQMNAASNFYLGLASNSTVTIPGGQPAAAVFNAAPGVDGVAVFNIDASFFSNPFIQQIDLNLNGATSIVINVSGSDVNYNTGNFVGNWTSNFARANTVWNFFEATSINFDRAFNGAVLAPNAHLTNSTIISGAVWVDSFTQNGEVHLPFYTGLIPTPGVLAMMAMGLFGTSRRRRVA